jgi:hypothetical protein
MQLAWPLHEPAVTGGRGKGKRGTWEEDGCTRARARMRWLERAVGGQRQGTAWEALAQRK